MHIWPEKWAHTELRCGSGSRSACYMIVHKPASSRSMTLSLSAHPYNISVFQCYTPTSDCDGEEVEKFYRNIKQDLAVVHRRDILMISGTWNACTGPESYPEWCSCVGMFGYAETNSRGLRLVQCATRNDSVLAKTLFKHKPARRRTWT